MGRMSAEELIARAVILLERLLQHADPLLLTGLCALLQLQALSGGGG